MTGSEHETNANRHGGAFSPSSSVCAAPAPGPLGRWTSAIACDSPAHVDPSLRRHDATYSVGPMWALHRRLRPSRFAQRAGWRSIHSLVIGRGRARPVSIFLRLQWSRAARPPSGFLFSRRKPPFGTGQRTGTTTEDPTSVSGFCVFLTALPYPRTLPQRPLQRLALAGPPAPSGLLPAAEVRSVVWPQSLGPQSPLLDGRPSLCGSLPSGCLH